MTTRRNFHLVSLTLSMAIGMTSAFAANWTTATNTNPINDAKRTITSTVSTNTIELSFPYNQPQHGGLIFRHGYGDQNHALLFLRRGAFNCPISCTVYVRADGGKAKKFSAVQSDDYSNQNMIFIDGRSELLRIIEHSRNLRIIFDVYDDGQQYFDFDVANFPKQ